MKTAKIAFLLAAILGSAACSNAPPEPQPGPSSVTSPASATSPNLTAARSDVVAAKLFARPPIDVVRSEIAVSQAVSPVDKVVDEGVPTETTHTDALHIIPAGVARGSAHTIAIDSTDGEASLFLGPRTDSPREIDAALRDIEVLDPRGVRVNVRAPKAGVPEAGKVPMSMIPLAGHPAGLYTVKVGELAAKVGVALEARLPQSKITMKLLPSVLQHLHGNDATFEAAIEEGGTPVTGATLTARLVDPDLKDGAPVVFKEISPGRYRASVASLFHETDRSGAYLVDVRAEGTTPSGLKFLRHGRNGFHFGVPTARIASVGDPRAVMNAQGLVEAFEVDVAVESSATDRFEISGTLAANAADGAEHAVAMAHYGNVLDAGLHHVTLRFDAGHARLTRLEGTYVLRNLKLYSLGTNTLLHRTLRPGARIDGVRREQLAQPTTITPAMEQLIADGVLAY